MRRLFFLMMSFGPLTLTAQRWHITGFGGVSNYQGDLQERRVTTTQSHGAFGLGAQYDFTAKLSLRGGLTYGKVSADDKLNKDPLLVARNLNFTSHLLEGNLMAEYRLFDLDEKRFTPYIFAGLAVFGYDPYTHDSLGTRHYLQPYSTEGQGLSEYPDRKPYKRVQVSLPFGAGIKLRLTERVTVGYEIGLRKTFTDYLDDLSKQYVDRDILLAAKGPKAVELAYRGGELKNGDPIYPSEGTIRGGAHLKDWYYFQGITVGFRLMRTNRGDDSRGGGRSNQLDCPKNVL